ncbi:P-loop containing nucleoside triphosphate hydrolase protein [Cystobasidium minutum MCA 4210]|uniref:P-loop containing nucleoside triphosphate hydrolase protein n=1 Tax=Cystobasidium minutum MCA 4210 TaxID=1397322 RepID=UPI0034CE7D9D|eukprot:jgi/Rhomi1/169131/fgenesh1_kg.3_\
MRRRKPQSGKAKKEHLQAKRAEKRDDGSRATSPSRGGGPARPVTAGSEIVKRHAVGRGALSMLAEDRQRAEARRAARTALESRFIKLPQDYVDHYRSVLAKRPFSRPINPAIAKMTEEDLSIVTTDDNRSEDCLYCPKRPKWKYYMTKKEVEKNESVMFENWLSSTETKLQKEEAKSEYRVMGYFERNLDVWRQLWRVSEVSEILLVLLDVRCPLLHLPTSLQDYVATLKPRKKCILVLTKVDLVPEEVAKAWKAYLQERYKFEVIMVESYKEHTKGENTQGTRTRFDPGASMEVRKSLVAALKNAHRELCTPPEQMKEEKKARWRPRVRSDIEWDTLINVPKEEALRRAEIKARRDMQAYKVGRKGNGASSMTEANVEELSKAEAKKMRRLQRQADLEKKSLQQKVKSSQHHETDEEDSHDDQAEAEEKDDLGHGAESEDEDRQGEEHQQPPYLSIGLIGQPNVGKSSLLNALLGRKVVRASRTPGKTKSLQTIYWSKEVRLVDCPGLVFPSFVGMEKQVMAGIIPIQNVEAVIYELGERMPLEEILDLKMPGELLDDRKGEVWSTDTLLGTLALDRGFLTAKAARPDVYRAGSMIIRAFHSSQIAWSFRPTVDEIASIHQEGIWIPGFQQQRQQVGAGQGFSQTITHMIGEATTGGETEEALETTEEEEVDSDGISDGEGEASSQDEEEDQDAEERTFAQPSTASRSAFALLALDGDASGEEESD